MDHSAQHSKMGENSSMAIGETNELVWQSDEFPLDGETLTFQWPHDVLDMDLDIDSCADIFSADPAATVLEPPQQAAPCPPLPESIRQQMYDCSNYGSGSSSSDMVINGSRVVAPLTSAVHPRVPAAAAVTNQGGSGACAGNDGPTVCLTVTENRGKGKEVDGQSQSLDVEDPSTKKQLKRSRTTEIHNLYEKRRRNKFNEKMKALQEIIPHCYKTDRVSVLDETIRYIKSLQMELQMVKMGANMVPNMLPKQYQPPTGTGTGTGTGMGMNRSMAPFTSFLPSSELQTPAPAPRSVSRFFLPSFQYAPLDNNQAPIPSSIFDMSGSRIAENSNTGKNKNPYTHQ